MYKRLRDLREDHDYNQTQVGAVLFLSQRAYSHIERGDNGLKIEYLNKLSKFYNVNPDYILGISDVSEPYNKKNEKK